jgi:hypothetical protein
MLDHTDEPAFPQNDAAYGHRLQGMSLRDYFAAHIIQGYATSVGSLTIPNFKKMANEAYELADAMLEARK